MLTISYIFTQSKFLLSLGCLCNISIITLATVYQNFVFSWLPLFADCSSQAATDCVFLASFPAQDRLLLKDG